MPADVTDPLLWRMANAVAAAHQPAADGCCTNLQCRTTTAPCPPSQLALDAMRRALATNLTPTRPQHPKVQRRATVSTPTAGAEHWLGEIEGIDITLTRLAGERDQAQRIAANHPVPLGMPTPRTARTSETAVMATAAHTHTAATARSWRWP